MNFTGKLKYPSFGLEQKSTAHDIAMPARLDPKGSLRKFATYVMETLNPQRELTAAILDTDFQGVNGHGGLLRLMGRPSATVERLARRSLLRKIAQTGPDAHPIALPETVGTRLGHGVEAIDLNEHELRLILRLALGGGHAPRDAANPAQSPSAGLTESLLTIMREWGSGKPDMLAGMVEGLAKFGMASDVLLYGELERARGHLELIVDSLPPTTTDAERDRLRSNLYNANGDVEKAIATVIQIPPAQAQQMEGHTATIRQSVHILFNSTIERGKYSMGVFTRAARRTAAIADADRRINAAEGALRNTGLALARLFDEATVNAALAAAAAAAAPGAPAPAPAMVAMPPGSVAGRIQAAINGIIDDARTIGASGVKLVREERGRLALDKEGKAEDMLNTAVDRRINAMREAVGDNPAMQAYRGLNEMERTELRAYTMLTAKFAGLAGITNAAATGNMLRDNHPAWNWYGTVGGARATVRYALSSEVGGWLSRDYLGPFHLPTQKRWGLVAVLPATLAAAYGFSRTDYYGGVWLPQFNTGLDITIRDGTREEARKKLPPAVRTRLENLGTWDNFPEGIITPLLAEHDPKDLPKIVWQRATTQDLTQKPGEEWMKKHGDFLKTQYNTEAAKKEDRQRERKEWEAMSEFVRRDDPFARFLDRYGFSGEYKELRENLDYLKKNTKVVSLVRKISAASQHAPAFLKAQKEVRDLEAKIPSQLAPAQAKLLSGQLAAKEKELAPLKALKGRAAKKAAQPRVKALEAEVAGLKKRLAPPSMLPAEIAKLQAQRDAKKKELDAVRAQMRAAGLDERGEWMVRLLSTEYVDPGTGEKGESSYAWNPRNAFKISALSAGLKKKTSEGDVIKAMVRMGMLMERRSLAESLASSEGDMLDIEPVETLEPAPKMAKEFENWAAVSVPMENEVQFAMNVPKEIGGMVKEDPVAIKVDAMTEAEQGLAATLATGEVRKRLDDLKAVMAEGKPEVMAARLRALKSYGMKVEGSTQASGEQRKALDDAGVKVERYDAARGQGWISLTDADNIPSMLEALAKGGVKPPTVFSVNLVPKVFVSACLRSDIYPKVMGERPEAQKPAGKK